MTEYRVELVKADSDHPLAEYVEEDEQLFVISVNGNVNSFDWFCAEDFFACVGECKFTITERDIE